MADIIPLGQRLRMLREALGYSALELAERTAGSVSRQTLVRAESGASIKVDVLLSILQALHLTTEGRSRLMSLL